MKNQKIITCWLPGWASDFSPWNDLISQRFPRWEHHFASYSDLLNHSDDLSALPILSKSQVVIAWSLGSLIALQNAPLWKAEQKLVLLSPFTNFCEGKGAWPPRILQMMERKVKDDPLQVLTDFSHQLGPIKPDDKKLWLQNALEYSPTSLTLGLEYLRTQKTDIPKHNIAAEIYLLAGEEDKIVASSLGQNLATELKVKQHKILPASGHWPLNNAFLDAIEFIEKQIC
ncbi:MAG: alpha/beta hydrolase [Fibrobacter sp.]|nr:alpha/beta hydrolase [Fibrobacter sp.]